MEVALLVFAGLMGASGIALTAASAHGTPGAGLDSAGYLLLIHAASVIGGVALLHQAMLSRIVGLVALCGFVVGAALFAADVASRAAAAWAARDGRDVLLVDAAKFPRDKTCGDGLTPRAVRQLINLGIPLSETDGWAHNKGLRIIGGGMRLQLDWPEVTSFPGYGMARARGDLDEVISSGRTLDYASRIYLTTGDPIYSNRSNVLLRIVADTVGRHDFLLTPCSTDTVLIRFPNIRKGAGCPSISLKPYFFHALRAKLRPDMSGTQFETV